jgi:hypothetical protein
VKPRGLVGLSELRDPIRLFQDNARVIGINADRGYFNGEEILTCPTFRTSIAQFGVNFEASVATEMRPLVRSAA